MQLNPPVATVYAFVAGKERTHSFVDRQEFGSRAKMRTWVNNVKEVRQ